MVCQLTNSAWSWCDIWVFNTSEFLTQQGDSVTWQFVTISAATVHSISLFLRCRRECLRWSPPMVTHTWTVKTSILSLSTISWSSSRKKVVSISVTTVRPSNVPVRLRRRLRLSCHRHQTEINLPFITADASGPRHINSKLLRSQFESLVAPLVQRTVDPCRKALSDAGIKASKINEVILVGGMTRMPRVTDTVKSIFGREPSKGVNPDEAVPLSRVVSWLVTLPTFSCSTSLPYLLVCVLGLS